MITLVPVGGLANRMRSIASGVSLSQKYGETLQIIWYKDTGLNCCFRELFQPLLLSDVNIREATKLDMLLYDRPRKKNFQVPRFFQQFLFDTCLYERDARTQTDNEFDYCEWSHTFQRKYIASYNSFFPATPALLHKLFIPVQPVQDKIQEYVSHFGVHTIGIHIRRGDHQTAISQSPLKLFIQQMDKELEQQESTFFLATDSEEEKQTLLHRYGDRIITTSQPAHRNSIAGMQQAVTELYTLAATQKIIGSYKSSFSEIAATLSGCPLITIIK